MSNLASSTGAPGECHAGVAPEIHSLQVGPRRENCGEALGKGCHQEGFPRLGRLGFEGYRWLGQEVPRRQELAVEAGPECGDQEERSEAGQAHEAACRRSQEGGDVDKAGSKQGGTEQVHAHQELGVHQDDTVEGCRQEQGRPRQGCPEQGSARQGGAKQDRNDEKCADESHAGEGRSEQGGSEQDGSEQGGILQVHFYQEGPDDDTDEGRDEVDCEQDGQCTGEGCKDVDQTVGQLFVGNCDIDKQEARRRN